MMGSPYYYDVHFDPFDVVLHDCMWSGTCCIQLVQQQPAPHHNQQQQPFGLPPSSASEIAAAAAATLAASSATVAATNTSGVQASSSTSILFANTSSLERTTNATIANINATAEGSVGGNSSRSTNKAAAAQAAKVTAKPPTSSLMASMRGDDDGDHDHDHDDEQKPDYLVTQSRRYGTIATGKRKSQRAVELSFALSSTRKKLRHREVEKNRHRQLQAMVKTLSERIPGKIEKETQVQTMKRAAKYCLYLHDVLTHGHVHLGKDKLERLYLRSCENVDLMMAADGGGEGDCGDEGDDSDHKQPQQHKQSRNNNSNHQHHHHQDDGGDRLAVRPSSQARSRPRQTATRTAVESATAKLIP